MAAVAAFAVSVSGENLLVFASCCISKTSCYYLGLACNVLKFWVFCYIALHFHLVFLLLVIKLQIFPFHSLILAFLVVLIPSLMCSFFSHSQS